MKTFKLLSATMVVMGLWQISTAVANEIEPDAFTSASCIQNKNDPYDTGVTMHTGPYKGKCADLSLHRPVVILSEDENQITYANFYHDKHFWIATMPKTGVDQVIFQIAHFPNRVPGVKFAHTQLRLILKPGQSIRLVPQDPTLGLQPAEVSDFALVDQTLIPQNLTTTYNPFKALSSTYGNVLRVMDTDDRAHEELGGNDDETNQYLLNLTDDEKNAVMINGVRLSSQTAYTDTYQLLSDNCTTVSFKILDDSIEYAQHVSKFKIYPWDLLDPIVGTSMRALKKRHLIEKELQTWNVETGLK